jgi:hypothetical protein
LQNFKIDNRGSETRLPAAVYPRPAPGSGRAAGRARFTAIFGKVEEEIIHRPRLGGVEHLPPETALGNEPGVRQVREVERERGRDNAEPFGNNTRRKTLGSGGDQQTEELQARFLGKGAERGDRTLLIHSNGAFNISMNVEIPHTPTPSILILKSIDNGELCGRAPAPRLPPPAALAVAMTIPNRPFEPFYTLCPLGEKQLIREAAMPLVTPSNKTGMSIARAKPAIPVPNEADARSR